MSKRIIALALCFVLCCTPLLTSCELAETLLGGLINSSEGDKGDVEYLEDMADIDVPERFKQAYTIDREKLEGAAEAAIEKLKAFVTENGTGFLGTSSTITNTPRALTATGCAECIPALTLWLISLPATIGSKTWSNLI